MNDPRAMGVVQVMSEELAPPTNLNLDMLKAVTRVYPRVTAGTPRSFSTDETNQFTYTYSPQLPNGQPGTGTTVIVVPAGLYPDGFVPTAIHGKGREPKRWNSGSRC